MESVDVNAASPWQLAVLLDLTRPEVEAVLLARPFSTAEAFHRALPSRLVQEPFGLEVPKRDINIGTDEELVKATGIPLDVARRIVNARPFFFSSQIRTLVGEEIFGQIEPLFAAPELEYTDKLTGRAVTLTADPSRVLVPKADSESVSDVVVRRNLQPLFPQAKGSLYEVLAIPETEEATDTLSELQAHYGKNMIPAYQDALSDHRYLNPRFCSVQFAPGVPQQRQEEIISELGLQVEEQHRTPGLYTLLIPQAQTAPAALARVLQELNERPEVKFSEPNYLGFEDQEPLRPPTPYKYRFFNCGCGKIPAPDVFVFCDDPSPFAFSSSSHLKVSAVSGAQ